MTILRQTVIPPSNQGQQSVHHAASAPILPLTSVRFFAAFYVLLLHSAAWSNHIETSTWPGRFIRNGYVAVGFFFVLSGYILAHVYLNTDRLFNTRQFLISRFARAYPLLLASLLLDFPNGVLLRVHLFGVRAAILKTSLLLVSESILLQSWSSHFRGLNAPSWSLSAEAFFYFIFPLCALWIWRRSAAGALWWALLLWGLALLVPIAVTIHSPALFVENDNSTLQWSVELMPIFRIFEFLAGIALCTFQNSSIAKLSEARKSILGHLAIAASLVIFAIVIQFANHVPLLVMSNGFLLPAYGLLILGLTNARGGLIITALSHRFMVVLGEASYALYLLHDPLWLYCSRVHAIDSLPAWIGYVSVVIVASLASFFLLERPARTYILSKAAIGPRVRLQEEAAAPL